MKVVSQKRKTVRSRTPRLESLSIKGADVRDLQEAWYFAAAIKLPLNRFLSIRPRDIDDLPPSYRHKVWSDWRNKLAQFARDNGFPFTSIWSRESKIGSGDQEHLHLLMHVPKALQKRFDMLMAKWSRKAEKASRVKRHGGGGSGDGGPADAASSVIDCRPADYGTSRLTGKDRSVFTYLTKNSPQAAWAGNRSYQKGGPILRARTGMSRNLKSSARIDHAAATVRRVGGGQSICTPHKSELRNYGAIIAERPVVTREMSAPKMSDNSNFRSEKGAA